MQKQKGEGKGKRAKAKAEPKGKRKCGKAKPDVDDSEISAWKKCSDCDIWKSIDLDFYCDQGRCKKCSNTRRSFTHYTHAQMCEDAVAEMKRTDQTGHKKLLKVFTGKLEAAKKTHDKLNFGVKEFIERWIASRGQRAQLEGEMMWEGEYMEFAKAAKAGYLSLSGWPIYIYMAVLDYVLDIFGCF